MRVAIIHSNQPSNQYAGGPTGVGDSEQAWMRKLTLQLADHFDRAGVDVEVGPVGPSYATNVAWVNARHKTKPFDLLISNHSNAAGDSMVLWGTSPASARFGKTIMDALNRAKIMPYGDVWTYYDRKVAEVANTNCPAVLLEWGRHDRTDYAEWLRVNIDNGTLARRAAAAILPALGIKVADPLVSTTPLPPKEPTMSDYPGVLLGRYPNATGTRVDSHPAVGTIQRWLGLAADNSFGPATEDAVKAFQASAGLEPDGIVGRQTWDALVAKYAAPAPAPAPQPAPTPAPTPAPAPAPDVAAQLGRIEAKLDRLIAATAQAGDTLRTAMGV